MIDKTRQGLMKAIRSNYDPTDMLVYADWLEEHGFPDEDWRYMAESVALVERLYGQFLPVGRMPVRGYQEHQDFAISLEFNDKPKGRMDWHGLMRETVVGFTLKGRWKHYDYFGYQTMVALKHPFPIERLRRYAFLRIREILDIKRLWDLREEYHILREEAKQVHGWDYPLEAYMMPRAYNDPMEAYMMFLAYNDQNLDGAERGLALEPADCTAAACKVWIDWLQKHLEIRRAKRKADGAAGDEV